MPLKAPETLWMVSRATHSRCRDEMNGVPAPQVDSHRNWDLYAMHESKKAWSEVTGFLLARATPYPCSSALAM